MKRITRDTLAHLAVCICIFTGSALIAMQQSYVLTKEQKTNWHFIKEAFDASELKPHEDNETYHKVVTLLTNDPTLYLKCFPYIVKHNEELYKQELWLLKASMDYYTKLLHEQRGLQQSMSAHDLNGLIVRLQTLHKENDEQLTQINNKIKKRRKIVSEGVRREQTLPAKTFSKVKKRTEHAQQLTYLITQLTSLKALTP